MDLHEVLSEPDKTSHISQVTTLNLLHPAYPQARSIRSCQMDSHSLVSLLIDREGISRISHTVETALLAVKTLGPERPLRTSALLEWIVPP
jgi:hypothetical protein